MPYRMGTDTAIPAGLRGHVDRPDKLLARGRRGSRAGRDGHRRPPRDDWRGRDGRLAPADGVEVHLIDISALAQLLAGLQRSLRAVSNRVFPRLLHSIQ